MLYDARAFRGIPGRRCAPRAARGPAVLLIKPPSLLGFIALENYLSDLLGVKVDLVMRDALKPHIGRHILDGVLPL